MFARLRERFDDLRGRVSKRARRLVAAVALTLTLATWGPMLAVAVQHPVAPWEKFVHWASGPFCHQLPERSFQVHGHVFPLCTRCTGMWLGITLGVAFAMGWGRRARWLWGGLLSGVFFLFTAIEWQREQMSGISWNAARAVLGFPIFFGFTVAVSYDVLALLLGAGRAVDRLIFREHRDE